MAGIKKRIYSACVDCGTVRFVRVDAKSKRCRSCSSGRNGSGPKPSLHRGVLIGCVLCGTQYYKRPSEPTRRFCSPSCANTAKTTTQEERDLKVKARTAANNALKRGRILRQPCMTCGAEGEHMHHEDYTKPLEVIWYCTIHHGATHAERGDLKSRFVPQAGEQNAES